MLLTPSFIVKGGVLFDPSQFSFHLMIILAKRFDGDHIFITSRWFSVHSSNYTYLQRNVSLVGKENEERHGTQL
ncbi:Uncharacterised protein [Citrobacter youngae]|uniref:Uncharacterized protein n=1 Tax=Citrobacter youngae TaxID=133448 RepID=A0A9Q7ZKP6_9ENTR|nr:Uncharacterised protein [Citrobacter youngae]